MLLPILSVCSLLLQGVATKPTLIQNLHERAECRTTTVNPGDGCWAVSQRCGISQSELERFNPRTNFCNTLIAGETVCCSSGTLPDTSPPPNPDGTCKTITVVSGDGCGSLASRCGIPAQDITKYNPQSNFCSTLMPGQLVCCGRGNLPDLRPKPNPDGSCFVYTIKSDDSCSTIAGKYQLAVADLETMNKQTWGWNGCSLIFPGFNMCLSTGSPPMPASVPNAICGPTVPGTQQPTNGTAIADLNPCPLKACCNFWGQCGTTADYCTKTDSPTGAPGTTGCISNCGMDIISSPAPSEHIRVGYFASWNGNRPCLRLHADAINTTKYTHIHFAFADITPEYDVDVSKVQDEFDRFKNLTGVKKIIAFGGWESSANSEVYQRMRDAVRVENRGIFRKNVVGFVNKHGLDGVDMDWEYPGSPDLATPDPTAAKEYMVFLRMLKGVIGAGKTVSFAAPASYYYLKAFPIDLMTFVDYVVYMTYDLHGQWDITSPSSQPGCPSGSNCLRSHVNLTETINALSMLTKAGMPSNKILVGVPSYGRSFRMADQDCGTTSCTFTGSGPGGSESNAKEGRCTGEKGWLAEAEIEEIVTGEGKSVHKWTEGMADYVVYGDGWEWVSYLSEERKREREGLYDRLGMLGSADWSVDLQGPV